LSHAPQVVEIGSWKSSLKYFFHNAGTQTRLFLVVASIVKDSKPMNFNPVAFLADHKQHFLTRM
jgi:hypothetical protein